MSASPTVRIRDFIHTDHPYVFDMIDEGFHVSSRFPVPGIRDSLLTIFLHSALLRSTHFRIALVDEKPAT